MIIYSVSFEFIREMVGILAGLLILCSFVFKNVKTIRIVNIFAAIAFIVYGVLMNSYSLIIMNSILVLIHIYYLIKIFKEEKEKSVD